MCSLPGRVEAVLAIVLVPAGLAVLVLGTWTQRLLLRLGAVAYLAGQVVVRAGPVDLGSPAIARL